MENILTAILDIILAVIPIIITRFLVPWLKANFEREELEKAVNMVDIAVGAAEQLGAVNGHDGTWKKQYVINFMQSKGFKFDEDTLDSLIECSVLLLRKELEA